MGMNSGLLGNALYREDLQRIAELPLPWERLNGRTLLISGASGMIGRFLTDVIMLLNRTRGLDCHVCTVGRSLERLERCFAAYWNDARFLPLSCDVARAMPPVEGGADFVLHLASNTSPVAYSTDPIGTIETNVMGARNLLELAARTEGSRILFASSVEIYGENRGNVERFDEGYCGYLDCNTARACYSEGKRCGEALCQAYIRQRGVDAVIVRLPRVYGPTMRESDTKAIAQFIKDGAAKRDIVLKSAGEQLYSYLYVADAAAAMLYCLFRGVRGEAYNAADARSDARLKDLAAAIARCAGTQVCFELPDEVERAGYSKATKALLDSTKLRKLGWTAHCSINAGLERTLRILWGDEMREH